jgi:hypothetical protein
MAKQAFQAVSFLQQQLRRPEQVLAGSVNEVNNE